MLYEPYKHDKMISQQQHWIKERILQFDKVEMSMV